VRAELGDEQLAEVLVLAVAEELPEFRVLQAAVGSDLEF
jgi:hypothetical protein